MPPSDEYWRGFFRSEGDARRAVLSQYFNISWHLEFSCKTTKWKEHSSEDNSWRKYLSGIATMIDNGGKMERNRCCNLLSDALYQSMNEWYPRNYHVKTKREGRKKIQRMEWRKKIVKRHHKNSVFFLHEKANGGGNSPWFSSPRKMEKIQIEMNAVYFHMP